MLNYLLQNTYTKVPVTYLGNSSKLGKAKVPGNNGGRWKQNLPICNFAYPMYTIYLYVVLFIKGEQKAINMPKSPLI